jgi:hypothetical protein
MKMKVHKEVLGTKSAIFLHFLDAYLLKTSLYRPEKVFVCVPIHHQLMHKVSAQ